MIVHIYSTKRVFCSPANLQGRHSSMVSTPTFWDWLTLNPPTRPAVQLPPLSLHHRVSEIMCWQAERDGKWWVGIPIQRWGGG